MASTATPRFSVFTPSHRPRYLDECLKTLQAQTCTDVDRPAQQRRPVAAGTARRAGPGGDRGRHQGSRSGETPGL